VSSAAGSDIDESKSGDIDGSKDIPGGITIESFFVSDEFEFENYDSNS